MTIFGDIIGEWNSEAGCSVQTLALNGRTSANENINVIF
jgi:hypothetical protein